MPFHKRKKKVFEQVERKIIEKDDKQKYALVLNELGNCRFLVKLDLTGEEVIGRLRGAFRGGKRKRKNRVCVDTVVLVSGRDYQEDIVDIIHVYKKDEVKKLQKSGEIVGFNVKRITFDDNNDDEETGFDFSDI